MHSNVMIKNVSWPHYSWPTLYIIHRMLHYVPCITETTVVDCRRMPPVATLWYWQVTSSESRSFPVLTGTSLSTYKSPVLVVAAMLARYATRHSSLPASINHSLPIVYVFVVIPKPRRFVSRGIQ